MKWIQIFKRKKNDTFHIMYKMLVIFARKSIDVVEGKATLKLLFLKQKIAPAVRNPR